MFDIVKSSEELKQYIYKKCNVSLDASIEYPIFVDETGSEMTAQQFRMGIEFLARENLVQPFDTFASEVITVGPSAHLHVSPRLIREIEENQT